MSTLTTTSHALALTRDNEDSPLWRVAILLLRPLHLGLAFPSILYVAAMTVFLFRPPDLFSFYADRIVFGLLVFFVALRTMALRDKIPFFAALSLPMLGLTALAVFRALREPFDAQTWSIIASKFIVPFALFHLAVLVFRGTSQRRHFEVFAIFALAYLLFIAIAFLADAHSLTLPGSPPLPHLSPLHSRPESWFSREPLSRPISPGGGQRRFVEHPWDYRCRP